MHGCGSVRVPKSNIDYWRSKLERNRKRDTENVAALAKLGWRVLTLWDCEIGDSARLEKMLRQFLSSESA
jgi:DNA mismatch endonuclease (patch repair protein)